MRWCHLCVHGQDSLPSLVKPSWNPIHRALRFLCHDKSNPSQTDTEFNHPTGKYIIKLREWCVHKVCKSIKETWVNSWFYLRIMSEEIRKQVVGVSFKDSIRIKEDGVIWAELEYMMMRSQLVGSSLITFLIFVTKYSTNTI